MAEKQGSSQPLDILSPMFGRRNKDKGCRDASQAPRPPFLPGQVLSLAGRGKGPGIGGLLLSLLLTWAASVVAQGTLYEVQSFPAPGSIHNMFPVKGLLGSQTGLCFYSGGESGLHFFLGGDTLRLIPDSIVGYTSRATAVKGLLDPNRSYVIRNLLWEYQIYDVTDLIRTTPVIAESCGNCALLSLRSDGIDINGDGREDCEVVIYEHNFFAFFLGGGDGTIITTPIPSQANFDARGDLNGDGATDLVVSNPVTGRLDIWFGRADMDFSPTPDISIPNNGSGSFGSWLNTKTDFNGDGYDDVAAFSGPRPDSGDISGAYTWIYFGGDPMDVLPDLVLYHGMFSGELYAGNFNNDRYGDYLFGPGDGYFVYWGKREPDTRRSEFFAYNYGDAFAIGDFNGDGADDAVTYGLSRTMHYLRYRPSMNNLRFRGSHALAAGWNLMAHSLIPTDAQPLRAYTAATQAYAWDFARGDYVDAGTLTVPPEQGFWVFVDRRHPAVTDGQRLDSLLIDILRGGWWLCGNTTNGAVWDSILTEPPGRVVAGYTYDPETGYQVVTGRVSPGRGFWLLAADSCRVRVK